MEKGKRNGKNVKKEKEERKKENAYKKCKIKKWEGGKNDKNGSRGVKIYKSGKGNFLKSYSEADGNISLGLKFKYPCSRNYNNTLAFSLFCPSFLFMCSLGTYLVESSDLNPSFRTVLEVSLLGQSKK